MVQAALNIAWPIAAHPKLLSESEVTTHDDRSGGDFHWENED